MSFSNFHSNFNPPTPATSARPENPNDDARLNDPPSDSIQAIKWSPTQNMLACASWDCTVKAYSFNSETGSSTKSGEYKNSAPALDVIWSSDGNNILSAGCDRIIKQWNPSQATPSVIGYHDEAIRRIVLSSESGQLLSGGWDKQLKCWDIKQSVSYNKYNDNCNQNQNNYKGQLKAVGTVKLSERVYAMDLNYPLLCVALANKKVAIFDLRNPSKPMTEMKTLLKYQLRCIAMFPNQKGFAVGSVEGRCAIHHINQNQNQNSQNQKNFAFKCHRKKQNVYAVNSIKFHRKYDTFCSAGGDGTMYFWDKDKKQKLKEFKQMDLPVTDVDFSFDHQLLAYAISYDWSKGIEHFQPKKQKPQIFIHKLQENEIMPKND